MDGLHITPILRKLIIHSPYHRTITSSSNPSTVVTRLPDNCWRGSEKESN